MSDESPLLKRCGTCGETKAVELFSKNKSEKDGRQKRCKACVSNHYKENAEAVCAHVRAYTAANADVIRERKKGYYKKNIATYHAYAERNVDRIQAYRRDYQAKNGGKRRERQKAYSEANPDKVRASRRAWRAANPEKNRAINNNRRARIKGNGGSYTSDEIEAMREAQAGICAYCTYLYDPEILTIDHIIPVDQGGSSYISNICLACARCNSSKRNRTPEQWTNRWYYREAWWIAEHGSQR